MIVSGPRVTQKGEVIGAYATRIDLAPTFFDMVCIAYPEAYEGKNIASLEGIPLTAFLNATQDQIHDSTYVFVLEHSQDILVRKGNFNFIDAKEVGA